MRVRRFAASVIGAQGVSPEAVEPLLARDLLAQRLEHLLDADELDSGAAVGLAAAYLGLVDGLPVLEADEAGAAFGEQLLDRGGLGVGWVEKGLRLDVGKQVLNGLQGVFLVGTNNARGAALDPARGVVAHLAAGVVGVEYATALVEDQAPLLVEGDALDRDAGVADGAQDQAALELFALTGVLGAQAAAFFGQFVATDDDLLDLAVTL